MSPDNSPSVALVRLPNPLGDVVMTTPLLRALKTAWPKTRIVVAGKAPYGKLLEGLGSVDSFVPLGGELPDHVALQRTGADLALILPNSWSSAIAVSRAKIPLRIGRRHQGRRILLNRALPSIPEATPMTELYADFLPELGLTRKIGAAELVAPQETRTPLPEAKHYLAVAPGAAFGPSKKYPQTMLVEALTQLSEVHGFHPILLGSPNERAELEELAARLPLSATLTAPNDHGLDEAKALIQKASVILAMDNGARHMAAALGTPQVVLYGPTHPQWSAHALEKTTILRRNELDCLNCHHKICPLSNHPCMTRIAPDAVVQAVLKLGS